MQLGVSVISWEAKAFSRDRLEASLRAAAETGFDAVAFSPTWYVTSRRGDGLAPLPLVTPNDALLLEALQTAARLGLATMLKPHVDIRRGWTWRGMIKPRQREQWWERYRWMIQHYAELAERAAASTFVIGTELERLTHGVHEERWRELIADVRARFSGMLTYTTNELHDLERVRFWDALDCIGLTLYPTLAARDGPTPPTGVLRRAWSEPVSRVRALHDRWKLPVLVTEVGFRSSRGGLYMPWDWKRPDDPDPLRQAAAYDASYEILSAEDSITGIYWWHWPADLRRAADDPTSYSPYGKPAGEVARRWNRRLGGAPPDPRPPLASVVVPVRDGAATITECLEALLDQSYPKDRVEIIAVDNGSTDRTAQLIRRLPVRYVYEPRIGPSHARNRGIAASAGEVLAFTDHDCIADHGWLASLIEGFDSDGASGVAGEIEAVAPQTDAQRYVHVRNPDHQKVVLALDEPFAITANVAFRREVFALIGGFDPAFVTAEDVDFGWRFVAAGLKMAYAPEAKVAHRARPSLRQLFGQQAAYGYGRAILRERYGLRRGYALPSNRDIRDAANVALRLGIRPSSAEARAFALYDLGVMLSLRAGELRRDLGQRLVRRAAAGVRAAAGKPSRDDMAGRVETALQRWMIASNRSLLQHCWRALYTAVARGAAAWLGGGTAATVYLVGSLAGGEPVYGLSDIDLVVVVPDGPAQREVLRRLGVMHAALPVLRRVIAHVWVYHERELELVASASYPTFGLDGGLAAFTGDDALPDAMALLDRPGLVPPADAWRRLRGAGVAPAPVRERQDERLAGWLEIQYRLRWAVPALVQPETLDHHLAGALAGVARVWLSLVHDVAPPGSRSALREAARRLEHERETLWLAADVIDSGHCDTATARKLWRCLVRLAAGVAQQIEVELSSVPATGVSLSGVLSTAGLPLLDWCGLALPRAEWVAPGKPATSPEQRFALAPGDAADAGAVSRALTAEPWAIWRTLRHGRLLIRPTLAVWDVGRLRTAELPASDPVSFALLAGDSVARFPDVRGWSAVDRARRAVAEHRGWLFSSADHGTSRPRWVGDRPAASWDTPATRSLLLSAARAALFLESLEAGEPLLALEHEATVEAWARRDPFAAEPAKLALRQLREGTDRGQPPPYEELVALVDSVHRLSPYAAPAKPGRATDRIRGGIPLPIGSNLSRS